MRKATTAIIISFILLTALSAGGCRTNPAESEQEVIEVTDTAQLERIWSDYIYDGITTVLNDEFAEPAEMEHKYFLISYVLQRMARVEAGETAVGDAIFREIAIPAVAAVQEQIKLYFGAEAQLDLAAELARGYGTEPGDTTVNVNIGMIPYGTPNPWGIVMDKVTYDPARSEYTVKLDAIANTQTGRVWRTTYAVLGEREDGSLYYRSVRYEYPETDLVKISGAYSDLDPAAFGAEAIVYSLPINVSGGDIGGKLLLRAVRQLPNSETVLTYSIYDPAANRLVNSLVLPQTKEEWCDGVRILPDRLIFKMNDGFYVTDLDLNCLNSGMTELPTAVREALAGREEHYAAYDVSADLKRIVYTDKDGLHLYDLGTGESAPLAEHLPVDSDLFDTAYILAPHFSAGDEAVIAKLSGYEGYYGVLSVNLLHPAAATYIERNINDLDGLDYTNVMYPLPNVRFAATSGPLRPFGIELVDLAKLSDPLSDRQRSTEMVTFTDTLQQRPLADLGNPPLYNARYLAYVAHDYESGLVPEEAVYQIVVVDLTTRRAETVLTLQAGYPCLRAVTGDGRVVLSYHFERESGLIITGEPGK